MAARPRDRGGAAAARSAIARDPDTAELIQHLVALGLTQSESRVYVLLARGGEVTATEAAERAGVPRPKVYEAFRGLEARGFCRSVSDRVSRYSAVDAELALEHWLRHRELERAELADRDRDHAATVQRLLPKPEQTVSAQDRDRIEGISGRIPTTRAIEDLIAGARRSLVLMLEPPFLQPRARWNVMEVEAIARGVEVKALYTPAGIVDRQRYEALLLHGGQIRVVDRLPQKLLVRDDEEALIMLRDAGTGAQSLTTAAVRGPTLVAPLRGLFDDAWAVGAPIAS